MLQNNNRDEEKRNSHTAVLDSLEDFPAAIKQDITPHDLMRFAKAILFAVAVIFILGMISEYLNPQSSVFEACKTILPPIATLVIGFYFGKEK